MEQKEYPVGQVLCFLLRKSFHTYVTTIHFVAYRYCKRAELAYLPPSIIYKKIEVSMYMVSFLYKLAPFSVSILFAHEMHHCFLKGQLSASSRNNVPSFGPAKLSVVVIIVKWLGGCYSSERKGWPGSAELGQEEYKPP